MGKPKTFICTIPFQGKDRNGDDGLKPITYEPSGNTRLAYGVTRFPIIPVINGYAEKGDKIRVIAILTDGPNYKYNYETYFAPEVTALANSNGYEFDGIEVVETSSSEDISSQLSLFANLLDRIKDGEDLYACITYGTKPTPIVQSMALSYAYRLKKDTSVGCVVYGLFRHNSPTGTLYDTTALFYMDSIVNKLAEMKAPNPEEAIRAILGIGGNEDD
ncbi:MAG: hypothetical protein LBC41_00500 [Clostridiales bacterium]|jgi:hypothetical protein|nr:hypothetical protein [Clostridiales bacterium]MDR2749112.1 hypothetical protein [Clostridiales bacterium]